MDCFQPREIRLPDGRLQVVRCNRCLACLSHRQAEWITRLRVELEEHPTSSYFVTLTYDDEHLPVNTAKFDGDGYSFLDKVPSVRKRDIISFHMDLRKRFQQGFYNDDTLFRNGFGDLQRIPLPDCHFTFYLTSEYGPEGHRPHYHGLYFGLPEDNDLTFDLLTAVWKRGFTFIEPAATDKAAAYVAKYLVNTSLVPVSVHADRPFALMSKGLGKGYLSPSRVEWHRQDYLHRLYVPEHGTRQVLPRYLRDKILDDGMRADVLEVTLEREEAKEQAFALLDLVEQELRERELRHQQEEAERQALWRFKKTGKIK